METLETCLIDHSFFHGWEHDHLSQIAQCAEQAAYEQGQYIFREGEESRHFYAILDGKVGLEIFVPGVGPITIQTLNKNDVLGWSWVIPPHKKRFGAKATVPTKTIRFDAQALRNAFEKDPKLGYEFLKRLSTIIGQRLQATRLQLLDMYDARS
ncbi:MAG: cyclic nucleotide-binding domain-containing protein [Candidatus Omnitrophica bacterium]|nr:cyclic nucleotide-binding domain-containing protein [Candidatus Omnitrophota bacterium]